MKRNVGIGPGKCSLRGWVGEIDLRRISQRLDRRAGGGKLLEPPLDSVARRGKVVVVLDKLPVVDEILAEVEHALDTVSQLKGFCSVVNPADLTGRQPDSRAFDRINRHDAGSLSRPLSLELRSGSKKVIDKMHCRGADPCGRVAVVTCTTVPQSEPAGFARM